jgi:hypothetical protein
MKFFIPNHGDTVRVRLHTGEVVDAKYDCGHINRCHFVTIDGEYYIACNKPKKRVSPEVYSRVRFVGPSCDLVPS